MARARTSPGRSPSVGVGEQAYDLVPVQPFRDRLTGVEPRRQDAIDEPRHAPATAFGETKEGTQASGVILDRHPAEAAGTPDCDLVVNIVDADRIQDDSAVVQPVK